jgi:predicted DNA-binding transcriptional regulator AlpA
MQGTRISEMARLSEETERLLKPAEVAEMLGISIHTLKVWRHRKPPFGPWYKRFPGERGEVRYLLSEVLSWMRTDLHENYAEEISRRPQDAPESLATSEAQGQ